MRPRTRWIGRFQAARRASVSASSRPPHAGSDNARRVSFGPNRVAEVISPIGAVGEHLAWIIGQGVGSGAPIVDVGRRDRDLLDQSRCRVGADVGFEAVHRALALMLDPAAKR